MRERDFPELSDEEYSGTPFAHYLFGPDAPNVRDDDAPGGQVIPEAPPPSPHETVLDDDQFAPEEA
jgi:hypothetical protein